MNHLSESLLNEFLDNELTQETRVVVEAHVAECPECRVRVDELRGLFAELKQLADEVPARDLSTLVLTSRPGLWLRLVLAVQAGLALGVLITIFRYTWGYIATFLGGLHIWEGLSRPILFALPAVQLSLPKLPAYEPLIPLPILVVILVIVVVFWWIGNMRLLRNGSDFQT
jgi:predicted anti-sigma-YlaC factor YlaD